MQVGGRKLLTRVWVDFELNKCSKFADKSALGYAIVDPHIARTLYVINRARNPQNEIS